MLLTFAALACTASAVRMRCLTNMRTIIHNPSARSLPVRNAHMWGCWHSELRRVLCVHFRGVVDFSAGTTKSNQYSSQKDAPSTISAPLFLTPANVAGSPRPRTAFYFYTRFQLTHDATTPTLLATLLPILLSSHTPSEIRPVFRSVPPAMHCSQPHRSSCQSM